MLGRFHLVRAAARTIEDEDEKWVRLGLFRREFLVPETGNQMIVHHPHGLHKSVTRCWAKKLESLCFQSLGEFLRLFGLSRNVARFPTVLYRFAADCLPEKP